MESAHRPKRDVLTSNALLNVAIDILSLLFVCVRIVLQAKTCATTGTGTAIFLRYAASSCAAWIVFIILCIALSRSVSCRRSMTKLPMLSAVDSLRKWIVLIYPTAADTCCRWAQIVHQNRFRRASLKMRFLIWQINLPFSQNSKPIYVTSMASSGYRLTHARAHNDNEYLFVRISQYAPRLRDEKQTLYAFGNLCSTFKETHQKFSICIGIGCINFVHRPWQTSCKLTFRWLTLCAQCSLLPQHTARIELAQRKTVSSASIHLPLPFAPLGASKQSRKDSYQTQKFNCNVTTDDLVEWRLSRVDNANSLHRATMTWNPVFRWMVKNDVF